MPKSIREVLQALRSREARIEAADLHPHEIDGSNFPEGVQEYDATEALPDPLETLESEEKPGDPLSHLNNVILTKTSQLVGRVITLDPLTDPVRPVEIITLRAQDNLNSMLSVSLSQVPQPFTSHLPGKGLFGGSTTDAISSYAVIEWGAGSSQFSSQVDVIPGQVFTVGGSFLRILGVNRHAELAKDFSAFISLLPKGSQKHSARKTELIGAIGAGGTGTQNFLIPFAKTVTVIRAPASAPFTMRFHDRAGTIISEHTAAANTDLPEIPIPGNTLFVQVLNGAVPITSSHFVYSLDL